MVRSHLNKIVLVAALGILAGCASQPKRINNVCAVFDQNDGFVTNWRRSAESASARHGIPVPVLMATVRKESGFRSNARPPREKLLGIVPWKRPSSAYGYSQALDGTWATYKRETGNFSARRASFSDAIDFVGWYHARSSRELGIAPNDAYRLYIAYYAGWTGYRRGNWSAGIDNTARETHAMAVNYADQMARCR